MHLFRVSASHYSSTPLLQKDFPGPSPRVSILWQIHFGGARIGIGERADTLDDVEPADARSDVYADAFIIFGRNLQF